MIYADVEQRSKEWFDMRAGSATGSRILDIVDRLKVNGKSGKAGDYKQAHQDYKWELVCERLTGRCMDHFVTPYMEDGIANEPLARAAYEIETGADVYPIGLAMHDRIKWFSASPDSLVGEDGLLEIKCLKSTNHLEIIRSGVIPAEYCPQLLAEMACTGRQWVDFVCFDPNMPEELQLFVRRFQRNDELIVLMEQEVEKFLAEVEEALAAVKSGAMVEVTA